MSTDVHVDVRSFTPEQRREIALRYVGMKQGTKGAYAARLGLRGDQIRKWISALADGDLDNGRFPRKTGTMTSKDTAEVQRLQKLLTQSEAQRKSETQAREEELMVLRAQYEQQLQAKDAEITKLDKAADLLGKAITVLQNLSEAGGKAEENSTTRDNNDSTSS